MKFGPSFVKKFPGDSSAVTDKGFEICGYMNTHELPSTLKPPRPVMFLPLLLTAPAGIPLSSKHASRTKHLVAVSGLVFLF